MAIIVIVIAIILSVIANSLIWIKDQLVHINYNDFEYPSFESLKYIQEYYMISNCLHVIWINYYLDSYVVENLCMENVFWIHILIYYTYMYLSFIHFSKKKYFMSFFHKCIYYFYFFAYYWMYCSILVCIIMYCVLSKSNDMFVDTLCLFCFYLKMMAGASRKLHHWVDKHNLRHFLWCHLG